MVHSLSKRRKLRAILARRLHAFYEFLKAYFAKHADEFLNRRKQPNQD
jgi:hypothetical protein